MNITYLPLPSLDFSDCEGLFFFGGVIENQEMRKEAMLICSYKFRLSVINEDYLKGGDAPGLVRYKPWNIELRLHLLKVVPCCNMGRIRGSYASVFENLKGGDALVEGKCKTCWLLNLGTTMKEVGGGTFPV